MNKKSIQNVLSGICMSLFLIGGISASESELKTGTLYASNSDTTQIYSAVDQMPEIVGGLKEIYKHIEYPKEARKSNIEGRVFIRFVVDEKGQVVNPQILKDIGGGCGEAAVNGVRKLKFKPGIQNGEPVKVYFSLPVNFKMHS